MAFNCCCRSQDAAAERNTEVSMSMPKRERAPFLENDILVTAGAEAFKRPSAPEAKQRLPQDQFTAVLQRPSSEDPLGMHVELSPPSGYFVVLRVRTDIVGAVQEHNIIVPSEERIIEGDCIVSVNGTSAMDAMTEAFFSDTELELVVRRPKMFSVSVQKNGRSLGMKMTHLAEGKAIFIADIEDDGAVRASNADVLPGDRLVSVNGKRGVSEMVAELTSRDDLELQLARIPLRS
mmetsp:Transcript_76642/g.222542  ORF Transcript_76642/g.222542 Transcript_76642/m.222542 type:complete len:235 (+) Transcript_76642:83-787(+)